MKVLVVYDSTYGNTEQIARAIGGAIAGDVKVLRAGEVNPAELNSFNLLVVGTPTHWGKPLPSIQGFLKKVPESAVKGINIAAFDTILSTKWVGISGYTAEKIADILKTKGGSLILSSEGFFSQGKELKEGELERAATWANSLVK